MSNFTDFISSGGGSASYPTIFLHNSQTWVPPQDGNIMIHVIGAGGSGSGSTVDTNVESGAAGGYCRKNSLAVTTSGSFTVTIGAGGASRIGDPGAGVAGGNSTVAGTGLSSTLTANGGAGGVLGTNTYTTGGTASNGDVNYAGGRGGYQIGGGAVGLTGAGNDGALTNNVITNYGGNCDILGDFYSSSLGQLSGSLGGHGSYANQNTSADGQQIAGPLGGAGSMFILSAGFSIAAGHATIGGGGGFCRNSGSAFIFSGRGGEGCVVIQYIP